MVAVDISYAQGYPNYDKLATNISLIIARAGTLEGGGMLQDSKLENNRANARRLGKQFGTYLFNGPVDPVRAAEWYVSIIDYQPGDLTAIDVESPNTWGPSQVLAFLKRVKELIGVIPATYGSTSVLFQEQWRQVSDFGSPLWAANYGSNNGSPGRDPGNGPWKTRILWQYTSTAQHSGFAGSVDTNQINDAALAAYLGTSAEDNTEGEWSDMASKEEVKEAVREVLKEQGFYDSVAVGVLQNDNSKDGQAILAKANAKALSENVFTTPGLAKKDGSPQPFQLAATIGAIRANQPDYVEGLKS